MWTRLCILAVVFAVAPGVALAQDKAAADAAFREGKALANAGDWEGACVKFRRSYELDPAVGTLLNIADCNEREGKTATAWAEFTAVAEKSALAGQRGRADEAKKRAAALEPRLMRIQVNYEGTLPSSWTIFRDDTNINELIGVAVAVDPGAHTVVAKDGFTEVWSQAIDSSQEGQTLTVQVPTPEELARAKAEKDAAEAAARAPGGSLAPIIRKKEGLGTMRYVAIGSAGLGVALLGTATVFAFSAKGKKDDSNANCDANDFCNATGIDQRQSARKSAALADITGAIGIAAIATGAVIWFLAPQEYVEEQRRVGTRVSPAVGPNQVGIVLSGGF